MVNLQSVLHGFRLVVVTEYELASADIADAFLLRRDAHDVVGCAAA